jgi:hypothetical protein
MSSLLSDFVSCCIPQVTELGSMKTEVSCTVIDAVVFKGGLFAKPFTMYTVHTHPCKWTVSRRFSDFRWLRERLETRYPGLYLPPLPGKCKKSKLDERTDSRRQLGLQLFLNQVI